MRKWGWVEGTGDKIVMNCHAVGIQLPAGARDSALLHSVQTTERLILLDLGTLLPELNELRQG
jgi:hypothetical protein